MFAGIVSLGRSELDRSVRERVLIATGRTRTTAAANAPPGAFFSKQDTATALGGERSAAAPRYGSRALFVADARLDNRDDLAAQLNLTPDESRDTSDADMVRLVFERWGDAGVARILGAFAFAFWDADARRLTLGRDCLGRCALFHHVGGNTVYFATTLNSLFALTGLPRQIDELALANFMVVNLSEPRQTYYRGIERVPSRTLVSFDASGIRARHYWAPDPDAARDCRREQDYIDRARELLDQAVVTATRTDPRIGMMMSGGLDSTALAATAARLKLGDSISCYVGVTDNSHVPLPVHCYGNERDKVEALARMYPGLDVEYVTLEQDESESDPASVFPTNGLPLLGPSTFGWGTNLQSRISAGGHTTVLNGAFGNFALSWDGPYALIELLKRGRIPRFAYELFASSRVQDKSMARILFDDVFAAAAPGLRRAVRRARGHDPYDVTRYSALNPDFIAEAGLRAAWKASGFDPWFGLTGTSGARVRGFWLFDSNQYGRDRRAMAQASLGTEIRSPHADRRLAEFVLSVPEPMYRRNGVARSFARRVLADRLPPEIVNERKRGVQATQWFRTMNARRAKMADDVESIEVSPLARRMLDIPRLKRLLDEWPKDEVAAEARNVEFKVALARGVHIGKFIRWVEGGNT